MKLTHIPTLLLIVVAAVLTGCEKDNNDEELRDMEQRLLQQYLIDNNITQEPTASGMYYIVLEPGSGDSPGPDSWVDIQYTGKLIDGTVFETNIESVALIEGIYSPGFVYGLTRLFADNITMDGLREGILYMTEGEKARLIIPSELALGGGSQGNIPAYSTLIFDVNLMEEFTDPEAHQREQLIEYFDDPLMVADTLPEGIYYMESEYGWGDTIMEDDDVEIWYTARFLDGRVWDRNLSDDLPKLIYYPSQDDVVHGLMYGLKYMRGGAKGKIIVPYQHAFGRNGAQDNFGRIIVPPYMPVVFEVEVESVF